MKEEQIKKLFGSIPKFETYSKYSQALGKIFKSQNLESLIESLKRQKEISNNLLDSMTPKKEAIDPVEIIEETNQEKHNDIDEEKSIFDIIKTYKPCLNDVRPKNEFYQKLNTLYSQKKVYKPNLDPFKYNPNYNSIFKNIPSVKIVDPTKQISNFEKYKKNARNLKNSVGNKPFLTEIPNYKSPKNKSLKIKLPKLTPSKNIYKKLDKTQDDEDFHNHALNFSKCTPRKFIIPEHNPYVSYIEPKNYKLARNKNRSIDFNKMIERKGNDFVFVSSLNVPTFNQYNPRYDCIDKNMNNVSFSPKDSVGESERKKYRLKKLWGSYYVQENYSLIDNKKLPTDEELIEIKNKYKAGF